MALDYAPVEGKAVVRFLDDDKEETANADSSAPYNESSEGLFALVIAAGKKVPAKKGDIVITSSWAYPGLDLGDGNCVIDGYSIQVVVK